MGVRDERRSANHARFRARSKALGSVDADRPVLVDELVPFRCECERPDCRERVRLSLSEYESLRADPSLVVLCPRHAQADAAAAVVRNDEYVAVRVS